MSPCHQDNRESSIPPLESGDRLSMGEFLRRYEAMPEVNKAELIEGIIWLPFSVRVEHGSTQAAVGGLLWKYQIMTSGLEAGVHATIELDECNCPQPDAYLRILPEFGGQSQTRRGYVISAPELLAEISGTSVGRDLHEKFNAYERNGVKEYVVWRVFDRAIDWFVRRDGRFERMEPSPDGVCRSEVFSGLWVNVAGLLAGDFATVMSTLQAGLATAEHAEFEARLAGTKSSSESSN
ncbi:MAG: Uma2 family endonuclease [Planctomycetaceae bacterium]|nr:Uma2 family endonuclease [Planctomycetaceae bacterium]